MENKFLSFVIYILITYICLQPMLSIVLAYENVNIYGEDVGIYIYNDLTKEEPKIEEKEKEEKEKEEKEKENVEIYSETKLLNTTLKKEENISTLISINKSQFKDEYVRQRIHTSEVLVDEQSKIPTTPIDISKEVLDTMSEQNTWMPGYAGSNISTYIDLKGIYVITHIGYYDSKGVYPVIFSSGIPFNWTTMLDFSTDAYNEWKIVPVGNVETRYVRLETKSGTDFGISEIAIYGYKVEDIEEDTNVDLSNPDFNITVDKAIGANGFIDDPMDVLEALGVIREYHNFHWTLDKVNQNKFNPSYGGQWNFDEYYRRVFEQGIIIMPCIQGASSAVFGIKGTNNKPIVSGANSTDPTSYKIHASTMYQYAARYGSTIVDDSKLLLANGQPRVSGLGYISYYENWNEPDKTWEGDASYFSPYELAAMTSADYDGHEGTLGDTYGVKNADKNAKLVMGGLASGEYTAEYLELMKDWFIYNRSDEKLAFDVINFHTYCGTSSPEESNFKEIVTSVTKWRNINARDKEVWLTEYGWDSNTSSPMSAPNNIAQRDWLVRASLIALASGIDRVTMYMSRDASWTGNTGKYATSGLTTEKGRWDRKPSWYGMYTVKKVLTGYKFDKIIKEDADIYIYRFVNETTGDITYALWSPTSNGNKIENFSFNVGNKTKPTLTKLEDGYYDGIKTKLNIVEGNVTFDVTESPVFLTLSGYDSNYVEPSNTKIKVELSNISVKDTGNTEDTNKLLTNFKNLFDEQNKAINSPFMKNTNSFSTKFESNLKGESYPLEGYIDLGEEYSISHIGIYDTNGTGKIEFYSGTPGNFEASPFYTSDLSSYNYFTVNNAKTKTRYIKIVKYDTAYLNEVVFYGYSTNSYTSDPNKDLSSKEQEKELLQKAKEEFVNKLNKYKGMDYTKYTKESVDGLKKEIENIEKVLLEEDITKEKIDELNKRLDEKIDKLITIEEQEKEELQKVKEEFLNKLNKYKEMDYTKYTKESVDGLKKEIENIEKVLLEEDITKVKIDELNKRLDDEIDKLITIEEQEKEELQKAKDKLSDKLKEYSNIDYIKYTEGSIIFVKKELQKAEYILNNSNDIQEITNYYSYILDLDDYLVIKEEIKNNDEIKQEEIKQDEIKQEEIRQEEIKQENNNNQVNEYTNNTNENKIEEKAEEKVEEKVEEEKKETKEVVENTTEVKQQTYEEYKNKAIALIIISIGAIILIFSIMYIIRVSKIKHN